MVCSYDQYNMIIYGMNDCYCGIMGCCDIIFVNVDDLVDMGLVYGDFVDVEVVLG